MNTNYGKLNDGVIEFAPDTIDTKYGRIEHPNEKNYLMYGWKKIVVGEGFGDHGWYQTATEIIKIHSTTEYGKLIEFDGGENIVQTIEYAPEVIVDGETVIENPTEADYTSRGWKVFVDVNGAEKFLEDATKVYGVWTNEAYGQLKDGALSGDVELTYADDKLMIDGTVVLEPTAEQYADIGFLPIIDNPPAPEEGCYVEADGWIVEDGKIVRQYKQVPIPEPPAPVYEYSKLAILVQIKQLGYWEQVKTWIQNAGLYDEYLACQSFKSDNPYFKQGLEAIKQAIPELTDEVIEQVLNNSILENLI